MWAGPHSMEYQSGDVLLDALYGVWKQYFEWLEGLYLTLHAPATTSALTCFRLFWFFVKQLPMIPNKVVSQIWLTAIYHFR